MDYEEDMDFSNMSMEEMLEFMKRMKGLSQDNPNPGNIRPTLGMQEGESTIRYKTKQSW